MFAEIRPGFGNRQGLLLVPELTPVLFDALLEAGWNQLKQVLDANMPFPCSVVSKTLLFAPSVSLVPGELDWCLVITMAAETVSRAEQEDDRRTAKWGFDKAWMLDQRTVQTTTKQCRMMLGMICYTMQMHGAA